MNIYCLENWLKTNKLKLQKKKKNCERNYSLEISVVDAEFALSVKCQNKLISFKLFFAIWFLQMISPKMRCHHKYVNYHTWNAASQANKEHSFNGVFKIQIDIYF